MLGSKTLCRLFCIFKLFPMVSKGLNTYNSRKCIELTLVFQVVGRVVFQVVGRVVFQVVGRVVSQVAGFQRFPTDRNIPYIQSVVL